MLSFENDYSEGAHEEILRRLMETNRVQQVGYGDDEYSQSAKEKIRAACEAPDADVFFLVGGTQTNAVVIDSLLHATEGVVSAVTGHVNQHEAGAIEFTGHKVIPLPHHQGKIAAEELRALMETFYADPSHPHMVFPGMVYISHPTEYGTLYTREELSALRAVCQEYQIPLYLDGARLGYGLMSPASDMTLRDIVERTDLFYIGGTKVGALFGEAVVLLHPDLQKDFRYMIKRQGGMLAKGRLLGIQFETLFTDGLYTRIAKNAVGLAMVLRDALKAKGVPFLYESPTNQQFPILPDAVVEKLSDRYAFEGWGRVDDEHTATRICTSWATPKENVEALLRDLLPLL